MAKIIHRLKERAKTWGPTERVVGIIRGRRSYSQFGEDVYIQGYYDRLAHDRNVKVSSGVIADIGCCRPIVLSNSYYFYRRGWTGINVDPSPHTHLLFRRVRPRDVTLQAAIAPEESEGVLYMFGPQSVWNTLSPEAADIAQAKTGVAPTKVPIRFLSLAQLFLENLSDPAKLEILMIDTEGLDLEVLRTNDWKLYVPRVILIEAHDTDPMRLGEHRVTQYLAQRGYRLYAHIAPNLMFVRQDSWLSE